jgi:replication factor C subunit 3/5
MSLWVDRHGFGVGVGVGGSLDYDESLNERLKNLCRERDSVPHLLFYGPNGSGKRSRIIALLHTLFGVGASKVQATQKTFKLPHKSTLVEISVVHSNYHIELNPSDAAHGDRYIIQEVLKEISETYQLDLTATSSKKDHHHYHQNMSWKMVVINEADKMSVDAQNALRRLMESHMSSCRLILCCKNLSRISKPIKSRCLVVPVPHPTPDQLFHTLTTVAKEEKSSLTEVQLKSICLASDGDVRQALLMAQASQHNVSGGLILKTDWEGEIDTATENLVKEQSIKNITSYKDTLQTLLKHNITPNLLLRRILKFIMSSSSSSSPSSSFSSSASHEIINLVAKFDANLSLGSKPATHLAALIDTLALTLYKTT